MANERISRSIQSQLLASLSMLKDCIDRCPGQQWNEAHGDYPFSRVVFHTLFDCDLNFSENENELRIQNFHRSNIVQFGDYEEISGIISDREYTKEFINQYFQHCTEVIRSKLTTMEDGQFLVMNSDFYRHRQAR